jgi:hypothetical protein
VVYGTHRIVDIMSRKSCGNAAQILPPAFPPPTYLDPGLWTTVGTKGKGTQFL